MFLPCYHPAPVCSDTGLSVFHICPPLPKTARCCPDYEATLTDLSNLSSFQWQEFWLQLRHHVNGLKEAGNTKSKSTGVLTELMWSCVCFTLIISGVFPIAVPGERSSLYKTWTFRIRTVLHRGEGKGGYRKGSRELGFCEIKSHWRKFLGKCLSTWRLPHQRQSLPHAIMDPFPDFEVSFKMIISYLYGMRKARKYWLKKLVWNTKFMKEMWSWLVIWGRDKKRNHLWNTTLL